MEACVFVIPHLSLATSFTRSNIVKIWSDMKKVKNISHSLSNILKLSCMSQMIKRPMQTSIVTDPFYLRPCLNFDILITKISFKYRFSTNFDGISLTITNDLLPGIFDIIVVQEVLHLEVFLLLRKSYFILRD